MGDYRIKRPKLDAFTGFIDQWLLEDLSRNRKQRHTAKRVFERLRDEHGFKGGYTTVKNYVGLVAVWCRSFDSVMCSKGD